VNYREIFELHNLALRQVEKYRRKRFIYSTIAKEKSRHFIGIAGPRGVGKTVLLRQLARELKGALYVSLDTLSGSFDLFDFVKEASTYYEVKTFLLDEIHYLKGYSEQLKKIYDFLSGVRIIFTSSIALWMIESGVDLSRRVRILRMGPFSFREFLWFREGIKLKPLKIEDIISGNWDRKVLEYEYLFDEYLKGGLYPFTLEEPYPYELFRNIMDRVISKDIPGVRQDIRVGEIENIKKVVDFVGRSPSEGINYSSIARNTGITKYKAVQYVDLLDKGFILNRIKPYGTNITKEPKILMHLPYRLLYKSYIDCIGSLREDFFAERMKFLRAEIFYLKSKRGEKTPDFLLRGYKDTIFEIGGKGKGRRQFKGYDASNYNRIILTHPYSPGKFPLLLIGMLEGEDFQ